MTALALLLFTLGMSDLGHRWRVVGMPAWFVPFVVGIAAAVSGVCALGYGWSAWWVVLVAVLLLAGWCQVFRLSPGMADVSLAVTTATAVAALAFGQHIDRPYAGLARWFDDREIGALDGVSFEQFVLAVGCLVFLHTSANRIVRRVLAEAGPSVLATEATLKGGRILGPLERWFIFAMALAGQFAAIGAIVAAKGIVRFPEISRDDVGGNKAEYVLVGSFVSWFLALVFVPLF